MADDDKGSLYYEPTDAERLTIDHVLSRMMRMQAARDKSYNYFNDRCLVEYIDDSERRWNGFIPPRDDLTMDWQARTFNNFTRNVVVKFLSSVALNPPKMKFTATSEKGFQDVMRSHVLEKLYLYSQAKENGSWKFFNAALECVTKGTVVCYEGYRKTRRKVKEITKFDAATGKVEYEEKEILDYSDCFREVIPLEDFYVGNVWQPEMDLQPDVAWRSLMRKSQFKEEYGKYKKFDYVKPGAYATGAEQVTFYRNKLASELESDQVEVIRYFNRMKDWMAVCANGVLLYDGPIPFDHKKYPFTKAIYEPFSIDFFYGKSLPDKIATDQDVINTLWNMMLDQSYLSIFKPILNDDPDDDEDTVLVPGLVKKVNNKDSYRVLNELQGPDQGHMQILQFAMNFAKENSGGVMGGGGAQSPQGGKVTARQALMAEEGARQSLGLSAKMLERHECDAARLRCKNILQFYVVDDKNAAVAGAKGPLADMFRFVRVDGSTLSDGSHGTSIVRIAKSGKKLPTNEDLAVEEEAAMMQGENVEIHVVSPDYIRNMDFDVSVVPESSFNQQKQLEKAQMEEFIQTATMNPVIAPFMNAEEMARKLVEVNEEDPERFVRAPQPQQDPNAPPQPGQPGASAGGAANQPVPPRGASGQAPPVSAQINGSANPRALGNLLG